MNADGIYLATYSALLLNLKLIHLGHYGENNVDNPVPITEAQFVEEIHGSGILVYVSATWLCELYQNVLAKSLLEIAGYDPKASQQPALINLLTGKFPYIIYELINYNHCKLQMLEDYVPRNC